MIKFYKNNNYITSHVSENSSSIETSAFYEMLSYRISHKHAALSAILRFVFNDNKMLYDTALLIRRPRKIALGAIGSKDCWFGCLLSFRY